MVSDALRHAGLVGPMTDRPHACKDSPTGQHKVLPYAYTCRFCQRSLAHLRDIGWNVPAHDPDAHLGAEEEEEQATAHKA